MKLSCLIVLLYISDTLSDTQTTEVECSEKVFIKSFIQLAEISPHGVNETLGQNVQPGAGEDDGRKDLQVAVSVQTDNPSCMYCSCVWWTFRVSFVVNPVIVLIMDGEWFSLYIVYHNRLTILL